MHASRTAKQALFAHFSSSWQKNPGAYSTEPSPAAVRLRVLSSPPRPAADDTAAAALPGRGHRLVSQCLSLNQSGETTPNPPRLFISAPICLPVTMPSMGDDVDLVTRLSACRDLSVDAGLPHHQYQLQQLPQHYQHYLASPRMHHFPRNTSSAQVVCHAPCYLLIAA